ncbi:hypothetical protein PRIPAC_71530 [Pristionchus pacificus]|uniref:Sterile alpha motif containing protein n=1 Tax=Pristionchus pacificus TaxID=54126 RepID=A0A2A6BGE0_PRIPA|nr:hypothetical protein PRIPAC_71530 [Pristionchus pacificus]|eukprot:PDM64950.1 Sterile alpha motif containing protein [Pristionchus pacificus]
MVSTASRSSTSNGSPRKENGAIPSEGTANTWTVNQVSSWLRHNGFDKYASEFVKHEIDGSVLLSITESDLREKPLSISSLGDIKRLGGFIDRLKTIQIGGVYLNGCVSPSAHSIHTQATPLFVSSESSHDHSSSTVSSHPHSHSSSSPITAEAIVSQEQNLLELPDGRSVVESVSSYEVHSYALLTRDEIIRTVESPDTPSKSVLKLAIAFSYCLLSLLITAFVMVLVHDRVPDMKMYPPLPDIVLDNLPLIPWAFQMCEFIGVVLCTVWFIILFFHKHRVVIARRMFSLVGTVFLLRCITMMITSLSVPGVHLECRAKNHGSLWEKMMEAYHIWSNFGMSIQGVRSCGDYMFSGHTTAITLLNHFITEYTPSSWSSLHTTTWVLNLFGVFFILAGHEHYSIDVFVAFYISSRMFLYYHTYAYNHANLTRNDDRMRLWFPLGWFFEAGSIGKVPDEFEFPIKIRRKRTTEVKNDEVKNQEKKEKEKKKKKN